MTRVLVITRLFPLTRAPGLGIFLQRQLNALREFEFEFDVLVVRPWAPVPFRWLPRWKQYASDNVPLSYPGLRTKLLRYVRPPGSRLSDWDSRIIERRLAGSVRKWHHESPYDIVLSGSMYPEAEAACSLASDLGLPFAALGVGSDVRVEAARSAAARARLARLLQQSDLIVAASQELAAQMKKIAATASEPLVVYLNRDPSVFRPAADRARLRSELGISADEIVACYVGALWAAKGTSDLAAVLSELFRRHPKFRLLAVGEGPDRTQLAQAAATAGRPDAAQLPGYLPPDEVPRYLQAADFFVFPSHSEGMPQSVLEAMGCGLPVIGTRVGGIPEAVIDGETGILVEPRDSAQLSAALERMISDAGFRQRAGAASRARVQEHFDSATHTQRLANALRQLCVDDSE